MRKTLLGSLFCLFSVNILHAGYQTGDFLFLDLDCGKICDAIEEVSGAQFGIEKIAFSHVGLIELRTSGVFVWEAWPGSGLGATKLEEVLHRKISSALLVPIKSQHRERAGDFIAKLRSLQGAAYDSEFFLKNSKFYCSELFVEFWPEIFQALPMYFGETESSAWNTWKLYYQDLRMEVPKGFPGLSPLGVYVQGLAAGLFDEAQMREISK